MIPARDPSTPAPDGSIHPVRALRALRELIANPEDTRLVFTVIEALAGPSPAWMVKQLRKHPTGRRLLETRADILPRLCDRKALEALPDGSFGRAYLAFIEREGISPDGLVEASVAGESEGWHGRQDDVGWLGKRLRDTHDLWHVLTGYGGDVLGETALLAFNLAQTRNPGVAVMTLAAILRSADAEMVQKSLKGFRDGLRAGWLIGFDFESALARPLADVRRELGITPVPPYVRMRPDWTREAA